MIDLDSIKARAQALQHHAGTTDYAAQVIGDNVELIAEVERLRAAAHRDRSEIIRWLREQQEAAEWALTAAGYEHAAEAIERGDHCREEVE